MLQPSAGLWPRAQTYRSASASAEELAAFMRERGYTYVYAGERPGAICADALRTAPMFEYVYEHEGIVIFHLRE